MLSWRTARRTSGLSVAAFLVVGTLMPSGAQAAGTQVTGGTPGAVTTQEPAKVVQQKIPTEAVAKKAEPLAEESEDHEVPAADHVVAELKQTDLKPFSMLGVTWKSGLADDKTVVEVRWRATDGWSDWTELHVDPAPEEGGIPGTEPQWVDSADAAEVRVLSTAGAEPEGLSLSTIDPRAPQASSTTATTSSTAATTPGVTTAAATKVAKPSIISRAKWGASNTGSCDSPIYGKTTRGAVIHHTAGSNSYTKEQSAGIVKATQAYHKGSRGWCDIGYNFLVDRYGQIFEGRAGGTTKPVRAAHSGNGPVNEETMGVSLMGTFSNSTPTASMKTAVVDLVAWRFDDYGIPGKGTYSLGGKTLNRIAGHRNVVSTECPGAKAYAWLSESGGLRDRVVAKLASQPASGEVSGRAVSDLSYTRFNLAWRAVTGAKTYEVQVSTSSTAPTACGTGCSSVSTTAYRARGLSKGTTYHVWVRAIGSGGQPLTAWQAKPKTVKTLTAAASSAQDSVTVPSNGKIAVTGHGFGHGIGMSQYGAQNAAKQGVKYGSILSRYYPGTKLASRTGSIRVLISQDTTDAVTITGRSGLVFRDVSARKTLKLPTTIGGKTVTRWQIVQQSSNKKASTLQYRTNGDFHSYQGTRWTGDGQFEGPSSISLLIGGSGVRYRGAIRSAVPSTGSTSRNTVNIVNIEHYVRGVIAAEMPSSWEPHALYAQAVAARTYGVRTIKTSGYYDICSTTSCQVYGGAARETTSTNAAAKATAGRILTYDGKPAFTQFSSSSGGFTAAGSQPYLKAVTDPYDAWSGNANHEWTATVTAAAVEKAYPAIGTLKQLKVTKRNGNGDWDGRVTSLNLVGSKKTVAITGDAARSAFGLKSSWFRF